MQANQDFEDRGTGKYELLIERADNRQARMASCAVAALYAMACRSQTEVYGS